MKKFMLSFFLICCAIPIRAGAADFFNSAGSFKIAKAVKLGRGSAYNSTALQQINGSQSKTSCTVTACSAGQYFNESSCSCSPCPSGEDCGCKETYNSSMSVSNGSGSCGCPQYFAFDPAPGNKRDYTACKGVPCAEGEDCGCSSRYGTNYVSDGKGDCKYDGICPAGQYLDYFGSGCLPCPDNAVCDGSQTWKEVNGCSHDDYICGGPAFVCNTGYYLSSGSFCQKCDEITYFKGCSACTGKQCLSCKSGYSFDSGSGYCVTSSPCPKNCISCTASTYCITCASGYKLTAQKKCEKEAVSCDGGHFYAAAINGCAQCAPGTYSAGGKVTGCQTCPAGTYSGTGASSCTSCPAGSTSNAGASGCTICTDGYKYVGGYGCKICSSGYSFITDINGGNGHCRKTGSLAFGALTSDSTQCQSGWAVPGGNDGIQGSHCGKSGSNIAF